jgi:hypothetical protein
MGLQAKANTGSGVDNLATDLVAGEHIGLSKLVTGNLGTNGGPVSQSNPLAVAAQLVDATGASLIGGTGGLKTQGVTEVTQLNYLGSPLQPTNRLPIDLNKGTVATDPLFAAVVDSVGTNIATGGALTVKGATGLLVGSNPVTSANPLPSQLSLNNLPVGDTNALPTRNHAEPILVTSLLGATLHQDIMTGVVGGWLDTNGNAEVMVQVTTAGTLTAGAIALEMSNDPAVLAGPGIPAPFDEPSSTGSRNVTTIVNLATGTNRIFRIAPSARYIRIRVATVFAGGTVGCRTYLRDIPYTPTPPASQNVVATQSGTWNVTSSAVSVVGTVLDASLARAASGAGVTGANITGTGILVYTNITAVTGTTPTLILNLQVQDPVSLLWVNVPGVVFPTRTAVGLFATVIYPGVVATADVINMPVPRVYRLAWTIGGTTPSFTFSTAVASLI